MSKDAQYAAIGGALLLVAAGLSQIGKSLQAGDSGAKIELPDFSKYLAGIGASGGDGDYKNTGSGSSGDSPDAGQIDTFPLPPRKPDEGVTTPVIGSKLTREQCRTLVKQTIARHGFNVDPDVAAAMCMVESSGRVSVIGDKTNKNGPAWGILQVLRTTAQWLHDQMGYQAYPPTERSLLTAEGGAYYGCAYLDYLSRYGGKSRERNWIIQSYNAGPGNSESAYLNRVLTEMNRGAV